MHSIARSLLMLTFCSAMGCSSVLVDSGRVPTARAPSGPVSGAGPSHETVAAAPASWGEVPHVPYQQIIPRGTSDQPAMYHQVRAGETLTGIATLYGVTVGQLVKANGFDTAIPVVPGQSIYIPREKR